MELQQIAVQVVRISLLMLTILVMEQVLLHVLGHVMLDIIMLVEHVKRQFGKRLIPIPVMLQVESGKMIRS
jgi:hypothetical protein